jgi:predicted Zn-dependent protease with MMP-like domain
MIGFAETPGIAVEPTWWMPPSSHGASTDSSSLRSSSKRRGHSESYALRAIDASATRGSLVGAGYAHDVEESVTPDFDQVVQEALDSLPRELRDRITNVEIVVEDEPPLGQPLLGLYQGVPLTRRGSGYNGALPDKITIYRGPLERLYGHDPALFAVQVKRVVLHEVAHHFGISDERLVELDRY